VSPIHAFRNLSDLWQSAVVLGGAVSFGFVVALALAGWVKVPEKVEHQGEAIVALQADMASVKHDLPRIRCILEAMARKEDPATKCGLIP
jgi:hypothetical protein